jgi:hypothetical protein
MSRTFGHTKRNHRGWASYKTAKPFKVSYNRAVRHHNRIRVNLSADRDDMIFITPDEISVGNMYNHPGD